MMSLVINPGSTNLKISVFEDSIEKTRVTRMLGEVDEDYFRSLLDAWKHIEQIVIRVVH